LRKSAAWTGRRRGFLGDKSKAAWTAPYGEESDFSAEKEDRKR